MGDLALLEKSREVFRFLDAHRAHENGLFTLLAFLHKGADGLVLFLCRAIDLIVLVVAYTRDIGGDFHHLQGIDVGEFVGLGHGGAGHAGKLGVETEIILEGDGGQGLVLHLDLHIFLCFEGLMQPIGEAPSFHHAAGKLIDDDHGVVLDQIVHVALKQLVGA